MYKVKDKILSDCRELCIQPELFSYFRVKRQHITNTDIAMAIVLILIIPLLQLFGYVLFSSNEIKKGPRIMIISIVVFYLFLFPLLMYLGKIPDTKERCVPFPFMDNLAGIVFGIIPSLVIHLIYTVIAKRKNNSG